MTVKPGLNVGDVCSTFFVKWMFWVSIKHFVQHSTMLESRLNALTLLNQQMLYNNVKTFNPGILVLHNVSISSYVWFHYRDFFKLCTKFNFAFKWITKYLLFSYLGLQTCASHSEQEIHQKTSTVPNILYRNTRRSGKIFKLITTGIVLQEHIWRS